MPVPSLLWTARSREEIVNLLTASGSSLGAGPMPLSLLSQHMAPPAETIAERLSDACEMHASVRWIGTAVEHCHVSFSGHLKSQKTSSWKIPECMQHMSWSINGHCDGGARTCFSEYGLLCCIETSREDDASSYVNNRCQCSPGIVSRFCHAIMSQCRGCLGRYCYTQILVPAVFAGLCRSSMLCSGSLQVRETSCQGITADHDGC